MTALDEITVVAYQTATEQLGRVLAGADHFMFGIPRRGVAGTLRRLVTLPGGVFYLDQPTLAPPKVVLVIRADDGWTPDLCGDLLAQLPAATTAVATIPKTVPAARIIEELRELEGWDSFPRDGSRDIILFGPYAHAGAAPAVDIPVLLVDALDECDPLLASQLRAREVL